MKRNYVLFMAVALLVICEGTSTAFANWPTNGQAVCTAASQQYNVRVASDGNGGSIMTWIDRRAGNDYWAIYAQKLDADGDTLWAANGVLIRSAYYDSEIRDLAIASDGEGGAVVAWSDPRNYYNSGMDIYAQRIGADGAVKWTANGVRISSITGDDEVTAVVPDQTGGAIIAWGDFGYGELRVQRVNGGGTALWGTNGIMVTNNVTGYYPISLMADGAGGAYLSWEEGYNPTDLYMQRVNPAGVMYWSGSPWGIPICTATGSQFDQQLVSDGSGGAIIAWYDERDGGNSHYEIYAQRVNPSGQAQWTSNGVEVATMDISSGGGFYMVDHVEMSADGLGGAVIAWWKNYSTSEDGDIYAQRINGSGQLKWASGGVAICADHQSGNYEQDQPRIAPDAPGGAMIIWEDHRNGAGVDLYGQQVDSTGAAQWETNGRALCTASGSSYWAQIIVGGVFAWEDTRNGDNIYALKVASGSESAVPPCTVTYQFYDHTQDQLFDPDDPNHTPFLVACPQGDEANSIDYLVVNVDFDDAYMTRDIAASEITIDKPTNLPIKFFYNGVICADGPATAANGYETTITVKAIGGGNDGCINCSPPSSASDIPVRLDGNAVGTVTGLRVRGYDLNGAGGQCDGQVNMSDFSVFGSSYNKSYPNAAYNPCCDYNGDNTCNTSDFGCFGSHYTHEHKDSTYYMVAGRSLRSDMSVVLRTEAGSTQDAAGKVRAVVCLKNTLNLSTAVICFDIGKASLKFVGWEPAADFGGTVMVTPLKDAEGILLVGIMGMDKIKSSSAEIGTLVFAADKGGADVTGKSVSIAFGDVLDTKGQILTVRSLDVEQSTPVLRNVLKSNYPNPFNPSTTIEYSIANDSPVNLSIYNVNGQLVRTLVSEFQKSNTYSVVWDGKDSNGNPVESGVYFSRIIASKFEQSKKLILVR